MDQSFNAATMSIEQAADFIAIQAEIGSSRRALVKSAMSNPAMGALVGGGLGAGAGLLGSWSDDEEKRKNWLSNTLTGGLLGAGVGGAAGAGWDMSKNIADGGDPQQQQLDKIEAAIKQRTAAAQKNRQQPQDSVWNFISQYLPETTSGATPEELAVLKAGGRDVSQLAPSGVATALNVAGDYAQQPLEMLTGGGIGFGLGHLYDRAKAKLPGIDRKLIVTPEQLAKLKANRLDGHFNTAVDEISAARGLDGRQVQPSLMQRLRGQGNAAAPAYQLPTTPPPAPSRMQRLLGMKPKPGFGAPVPAMPQHEWNKIRDAIPTTRGPVGKLGKGVGAVGGAALMPWISGFFERPKPTFVPPPKSY